MAQRRPERRVLLFPSRARLLPQAALLACVFPLALYLAPHFADRRTQLRPAPGG